jgi:hypothetical protein
MKSSGRGARGAEGPGAPATGEGLRPLSSRDCTSTRPISRQNPSASTAPIARAPRPQRYGVREGRPAASLACLGSLMPLEPAPLTLQPIRLSAGRREVNRAAGTIVPPVSMHRVARGDEADLAVWLSAAIRTNKYFHRSVDSLVGYA